MKYIIIFATLLILSQAGSLSEGITQVKGIFESNDCLKSKFEQKLNGMQMDIFNFMSQSEKGEKAIEQRIDELYQIIDECQIQNAIDPAIYEKLGQFFTLGSKCFQGIGTFLLISTTIINDPNNITNDFFMGIFLYFVAKRGVKDCKAWINFVVPAAFPALN